MNILSLFSLSVFAAEIIISPLSDTIEPIRNSVSYPEKTFADISVAQATPPDNQNVLGDSTMIAPDGATDVMADNPTPTPTAEMRRTKKVSPVIAILGDSMVDTLGPDVPNLANNIKNTYPQTRVRILNYGVGATNIDYGIERIMNSYAYLDKQIPSLVSQKPDLVIIESFAYNPFPDGGDNGINRHWLALAKAVDTIKASLPESRIMIAVTIAPNSSVFGDDAAGLSFSSEDKKERTSVIRSYLDSTIKFAQSQKIPYADVYHASVSGNGDGKLEYINAGDHIHYSDAGRELFGRITSETIVRNALLE